MKLDMQPDLSQVDATVTALREAAGAVLSEMKLAAFEIAVAEALTNAVRHGTRSSAAKSDPEQIRISLETQENVLQLVIIDAGDQGPQDLYDDVANPEDIDLMAESGRGLSLIRHCVDDLTFDPAPGHNRLALRFRSDLT